MVRAAGCGWGRCSFQPSELAKYAVVLFVALALAARGKARAALLYGHPSGADCAGCDVPADIGAAQPVHGGHDYHRQRYSGHAGRARWRHMLVLGAGGLALGAYYAWSEPYRRERLLSFTNPFAKMNDEGYRYRNR